MGESIALVIVFILSIGLPGGCYWMGWKNGWLKGRTEGIGYWKNSDALNDTSVISALLEKNVAKNNRLLNATLSVVLVLVMVSVGGSLPN